MQTYTEIAIIYNPNSTGNGHELAADLQKRLARRNRKLKVSLVKTKHRGHGEDLAYELSKASKRPLIISASGDGGYHDVVNGIMRAQAEGADPVAGLLPAGNANDHYVTLHEHDVIEAIINQQEREIDLLVLQTKSGGKPLMRYAHSYIGLGLTPTVGHELNKTNLNRIKEIWIVLKVLLLLRPIRLRINGNVGAYDSIVLSNVGKMSKVLTTEQSAEVDDGVFEMSIFRRRNKLQLIWRLLQATTKRGLAARQVKTFSCRTIRALQVQADGELVRVDNDSPVEVSIKPNVLRCIV